MLSSLFQCNYCWFVNLTKEVADNIALGNVSLLAYITRRVNLDVMLSSGPLVVKVAWNCFEKGR